MTKEKRNSIMEQMAKDITEIKKLLLGNGKIGLCEQVRNNETEISYLKIKPSLVKKNLHLIILFVTMIISAVALYRS